MQELPKVPSNAISPVKERPKRGKKRSFAEVADSEAESSDSEFSWFEDDVEISAEGLINVANLTSNDHSATRAETAESLEDVPTEDA